MTMPSPAVAGRRHEAAARAHRLAGDLCVWFGQCGDLTAAARLVASEAHAMADALDEKDERIAWLMRENDRLHRGRS